MYHIFFIHSSTNGYLGCFYVLAIVNGDAMNTEILKIIKIYMTKFLFQKSPQVSQVNRLKPWALLYFLSIL